MYRISILLTMALAFLTSGNLLGDTANPPEGFRAIFNGTDLDGWHGLNPHDVAKLSGEPKDKNLASQLEEY